jgi:hypothetical protein
VVVSELDQTAIVPSVSSSTGAFVGQFNWGPVHEAKLVNSGTDFQTIYKNPTGTATNSFLASCYYSCLNFLSYSSSLYVVREIGANSKNSGSAGAWLDYNFNLSANVQSFANITSGNSLLYFSNTANSLSVAAGMRISGNNLSSNTNVTGTTALGSIIEVQISPSFFLSVNENDSFSFSDVMTANTTLIKNLNSFDFSFKGLDWANQYGPFVAKYPGTLGDSLSVSVCSSDAYFASWTYKGIFDGAPGTSDFASARGSSSDEMHIVVVDVKGQFTGTAGTVLEKFAYISKASDVIGNDGNNNYYIDYLAKYSNYIYALGPVSYSSTNSTWGLASADAVTFAEVDNVTVNLVGGNNGAAMVASDLTTGWDILKNKEVYDVSLLIAGASAEIDIAVPQYIIDNVAEYRKDCVAFISPRYQDIVNQAGSEASNIVGSFLTTLSRNSSYVVVDSGWKYQYDAFNRVYRWIPLNADTAGLCALTDYTNDSWWSPAGFTRGKVKNAIKLAWNPNQAERDTIYKAGVNPVVSFSGEGTVLYGDKTLQAKPSAFDRINVRRLFITLEKAIAKAAKFSLFELNDAFTRAQFVSMVEPYLREVQARRGLTDFRVVCNETNNTTAVISANGFVADIFIKPIGSVNFIQLNFIATKSGTDFNIIAGNV